ncbi:dorsal-ventral patterning protein tolloid-like [Phymastichus coffea]|uniref:dorsal-ventral patterning protein tolloid-like n=1 Tax=Phymastichus coffea TaxID=108790 RepID=UPI00273B5BD4|nr:dorsal-ventral patterning protein tolloid-like [Phymastichus coffea]
MHRRLLFLCCWLLFLDLCRTVNPGCSCVVYSSRYNPQGGSFTSPDFPKRYPTNVDCLLYTFHGHEDEIVELTFHHFNTRSTYPNCARGDYLKVFLHLEPEVRGVSEYTPWSGLLCGNLADVPRVLYSSGPTLIFEFHTEAERAAGWPANLTGFSGTFRFIDRRIFETDGQLVPNKMCDYQFVSSQFTPQHGHFYSPRYPAPYPENIHCQYHFRARLKERIRVVFEELLLEKGDASCLNRADLIRIHDGGDTDRPTISVLCNQDTEVEVLSTGPELLIDFVANSKWPGQGFKATFQFQPIDDHLAEPDKLVPSGSRRSLIGPAVSATSEYQQPPAYTYVPRSIPLFPGSPFLLSSSTLKEHSDLRRSTLSR